MTYLRPRRQLPGPEKSERLKRAFELGWRNRNFDNEIAPGNWSGGYFFCIIL
jgi:hypothetical protein